MQQYIKENKILLIKYLSILITNLLIFILSDFYFKNLEYKYIFMFFLIVIIDMIIYYYRGKSVFKYVFDIIANFIIGIIFTILFFKNEELPIILLFIFFANNIVFMKSRMSKKFLVNSFQYLLIILISIFNLFLNLVIIYFI